MFNEAKATQNSSALSQLLGSTIPQENNSILNKSDEKVNSFASIFQQLSQGKEDIKGSIERNVKSEPLLTKEMKSDQENLSLEKSSSPILLKLSSENSQENIQVDRKSIDFSALKSTTPQLAQLLHGSEITKEEKNDLSFLNLPSTQTMSVKEVKQLIIDAKVFLKDQIKSLEIGEKSKNLPKTVQNLLQVAKNIGIKVESITLKQISPENITIEADTPIFKTANLTKNINLDTIKTSQIAATIVTKNDAIKATDTHSIKEVKSTEVKSSPLQSLLHSDTKNITPKKIDPEVKTNQVKSSEITNDAIKATDTHSIKEVKSTEVKSSPLQSLLHSDTKNITPKKIDPEVKTNQVKSSEIKNDAIKATDTHSIKEVKSTEVKSSPLQSLLHSDTKNITPKKIDPEVKIPLTIKSTLHEITPSKELKNEQLMPLQKSQPLAQETKIKDIKTPTIAATISNLLKPSQQQKENLTKNDKEKTQTITTETIKSAKNSLQSIFNTIESKITPTQMGEEKSNLEMQKVDLLPNETRDISLSKEQNIQTVKIDSSTQSDDSKTLVKNFSSNFKEAVDNYKSPFTRLTMKLQPEKLGALDLTMVQRGKNLHINITSNDKALTMLSQNVLELKNHLNQVGINNASINFNGVILHESSTQTNPQNSSNQNAQNSNSGQSSSQNSGQNPGQNSDRGSQQQNQEREHRQYQEQMKKDEMKKNHIELEIVLPKYI